MGAHVLDSYFGGDDQLARSRSPAKPRSYALLERRAPETGWSRRRLRDAVVAEMSARSLTAAVANALSADELVRLHAVDDATVRRELAARIARGDATGRAARELIARAAGAERRGGRSPTPPPVREVGTFERTALRFAKAASLADRELGRLGRPERRALARRVREVIANLRALASRLEG